MESLLSHRLVRQRQNAFTQGEISVHVSAKNLQGSGQGKMQLFSQARQATQDIYIFFSSVCSYVSNNTISSMKIGNTHCVRLKTRSGIVRPHHAASDLCSHYSLNSLVQTKTAVSAWLAGTGCRQENQVLVVCGWPMVTTNGAGPYSVHTWRNVSRYTLAQTSISNQPP